MVLEANNGVIYRALFRDLSVEETFGYCRMANGRYRISSMQSVLNVMDASGEGNREGNGTPLQHSCLENPMDGGAW